jgi:nicotinate-nucleotide adenylyltransferase
MHLWAIELYRFCERELYYLSTSFLELRVLMLQILLCLLCFSLHSAWAIELEKMAPESLSGKKIGYYTGSFDPLHLGHEHVVQTVLDQKLCDYVLIYPVWGGDTYKSRIDIQIRLEMLYRVFKDHPKVIVTKMSPGDLQQALTKELPEHKVAGKQAVSMKFENTECIGIIGSDTALWVVTDPKYLALFMRGVKIEEKYREHTTGTITALPVTSFIVAMRQDDSLESLGGKIDDRPILTVIETSYATTSSTQIKRRLVSGQSIDDLISPFVLESINKHRLYMPNS